MWDTSYNRCNMVDRLNICTAITPHTPPVPLGYKKCPECGVLLKARGYGGHMYGIHGIRVGDKARLQKLWDWYNSIQRESDSGYLLIPENLALKFYQTKR